MPNPGHLTQEVQHLGVEPLGDLRGGRIMVGSDRAGDCVVCDAGAAVWHLLDEDGDRRVRAGVGDVAGHLAHGDRVAGDQADQSAPGPDLGLGIKGQHVIHVELPEPHQPSAALRLRDQGAGLLVGSARGELAEQ